MSEKVIKMNKTNYMANIYDGHTHIDRRIYECEGVRYVKINRCFFELTKLYSKYDINIWDTM